GVVCSTTDNRRLEPTTPSAPAKEASRHFLVGRSISLCFALSGSRFAPSLEGSFARPEIPSDTHQNDLLLNDISFHRSVEVAALKPEQPRGLRNVPVILSQLREDELAFVLRARFMKRRGAFPMVAVRKREIGRPDHIFRRHDDEPLNFVSELTDV